MYTAIITALAAIFVFGLLIIGHELGHFLIAKLVGVKVIEFSFGMGSPRLLGFETKETKYSVRPFPIGGYVKMVGEDGDSSDPRAFCNQKTWKRISIILAGPIMNFILAMILFFLVSYNMGFAKPIISVVEKNQPAYTSGLKVNDKILSVNGSKIRTWTEFLIFMSENTSGKSFNLTVKRGNETKEINLKPVYIKAEKRYIIGILGTRVKSPNIIEAGVNGYDETISLIKMTVIQLKGMLTGKVSTKNLGGPVAIVKMSGDAAKGGIWSLLLFTGMLSISLGIMNLIPFPALDGGWTVILLIEGITRKKFDENKIGFVNLIGFVVLIGLIILITFNDIKNIFI